MPFSYPRLCAALVALLAAGCGDGAERAAPVFGRAAVELAGVRLAVEVAADAAAHAQGLSGREALAPGTGMWFVYPEAGPRTFWMQGMRFAIDIVFIGADLRVNEVVADAPPPRAGAEPFSHRSVLPAQYVLEVPAGFCREHGVAPGTAVSFTDK